MTVKQSHVCLCAFVVKLVTQHISEAVLCRTISADSVASTPGSCNFCVTFSVVTVFCVEWSDSFSYCHRFGKLMP